MFLKELSQVRHNRKSLSLFVKLCNTGKFIVKYYYLLPLWEAEGSAMKVQWWCRARWEVMFLILSVIQKC